MRNRFFISFGAVSLVIGGVLGNEQCSRESTGASKIACRLEIFAVPDYDHRSIGASFSDGEAVAVRAANSVARVLSSHGRSHRFESCAAHIKCRIGS